MPIMVSCNRGGFRLPIYLRIPWETLNISPTFGCAVGNEQRSKTSMDNSGRDDRPRILDHFYSNSYTDQTGAEYCPGLLSAHNLGLSGGHDQGVNSTGVTSIAHPSASVPGRPFHEQPYPKSLEEGSPFYFHQQESAYATSPQILSYHFATQSQVPQAAVVCDNVYCGSGGHRGTAAYHARAPAEQWDAQAVQRPQIFPASYMQPPFVTHPPLENEVAGTAAAPESSMVRGDSAYDTGWGQDMGTSYRAHPAQWNAQASLGPMPGTMGDGKPTNVTVAPSHIEDKATRTASTSSTPKGPTHNAGKKCPICAASLRRSQDRKRHVSSHLPRWLQCQAPGCSWRGDRWEHLRKHRRKVHLSNSQESDTPESIIYDPWPLVERIKDNATFENVKTIAISLVEAKAKELEKSELWRDSWGRRRSRKVYIQSSE